MDCVCTSIAGIAVSLGGDVAALGADADAFGTDAAASGADDATAGVADVGLVTSLASKASTGATCSPTGTSSANPSAFIRVCGGSKM
jgi:hypothetical protein